MSFMHINELDIELSRETARSINMIKQNETKRHFCSTIFRQQVFTWDFFWFSFVVMNKLQWEKQN